MRFPLSALLLPLACAQPRAPSQEDACRDDDGCAAGLVCCHAGEEAQAQDRGFCVKRSVCATVRVPSQAPLPPED